MLHKCVKFLLIFVTSSVLAIKFDSSLKTLLANEEDISQLFVGPSFHPLQPSPSLNPNGWQNPSPFHVYNVCLPLIDEYRRAAINFTDCYLQHSLPPMVCTECTEKYIALRDTHHFLVHNATEPTILDQSCTEIMFHGYLVSYVSQSYDALTHLWDSSFCGTCINLWDEHGDIVHEADSVPVNYTYTKKALNFMAEMTTFRQCLWNKTNDGQTRPIGEYAAEFCHNEYDHLYKFFWDTFVYPDMKPFCLDIESSMNDTINLWRHVLNCTLPALADRSANTPLTLIACIGVAMITLLFYIVSYIQGERMLKKLTKYSNPEHRDVDHPNRPHAPSMYISAPLADELPPSNGIAPTSLSFDNPNLLLAPEIMSSRGAQLRGMSTVEEMSHASSGSPQEESDSSVDTRTIGYRSAAPSTVVDGEGEEETQGNVVRF